VRRGNPFWIGEKQIFELVRSHRQSRKSSDSGWVKARRAERSDRAEGARTAVKWQPAEQRDQTEQKELGQQLSDSPQSREIRQSRRDSDSGWVTARRAERSDRAEGARTAVKWQPAEQINGVQLKSDGKEFAAERTNRDQAGSRSSQCKSVPSSCNLRAKKSQYQSEFTFYISRDFPGTWLNYY
jgi:hypothetical protein